MRAGAYHGELLLLASKSPRRRELLSNAGIPFEVRTVDVPEVRRPGEDAESYVRRLARDKANAVHRGPNDIALGADTVVVAGAEVLEKPADATDAARMLRMLSGQRHLVITGFCLLADGGEIVDSETTGVFFSELTAQEIRDYVASGEPMDKAGAYAIQGLASKFIRRIEGDYFNVVGLPVSRIFEDWKRLRRMRPAAESGAARLS